MENRKLITALIVGCMAFLPAGAAASTISGVIKNQINTGTTPGVATVNAGDTLIIDDATIRNNSGYGGAFVNNGTIHINDGEEGSHTTFSGNSNNNPTMGGGAIYSYTTGSTKVYVGDYTSFENNSSSYKDADGKHGDSGGAIYVGNATLEIGSNVNFSGNEAISGRVEDPVWGIVAYGGHGGAIYAIDSDVTIENDLKVTNNKSIYSGGGAYFHNTSGTHSATIGTGAIFTGNVSLEENGGAIGNKNNTLTIGAGAEFTNNTAAQSGGAIYNTATVNVNGATFTGNKANKGGALYNAQNATASLQDVTFSAASGEASSDYASNSIYNAGSVTTASTDSNVNIFSSNITTVKDWTYTGNNVVEGAIDGYGTITNKGNTTFAGNNSLYKGSFTQSVTGAETTVTGTFFGGTSTVSDGTLNWETQTGIPSGGSLTITGGNLNIGSADGQTTGTFTVGANSVIGNAVNVQVNQNSTLANSTDLAISQGKFTNAGKVEGSGNLTVSDGSNSGTIDQNTFTNNGTFENSGNIGSADDKLTSFTNNGTFTNEGSLIAETINNNAGTLTNKEGSTLSADTFNNAATIKGTGELTLGSGENTGSITQSAITIATGGEYTNASSGTMIADTISISTNSKFNNEGSLGSAISSVGEIINDGIFTNTGNNSSIYANKIVNNENATFKTENQNIVAGKFVNLGTYEGSGSSALDGGENTGNYTDDVVTIDGSYNNTGSITANETFTNKGTITGNTDVSGEIAGSITVNDDGGTSSNSGDITQANITINGDKFTNNANKTITTAESFTNTAKDLANNGIIDASKGTFSNSSAITGGGNLELSSGKNTGSITQEIVEITQGGKLTSEGTDTAKASIVANTLTNSGTLELNNSNLTITNAVSNGIISATGGENELNASLSGGSLNIANGASLSQTGGGVGKDVNLDIAAGSIYDVNTGDVVIDSQDTWAGTVNLASGNLTTDGVTQNGVLDADTGKFNVTNGSDIIIGKDSSIAGDVTTKIDSTSTLNINGGSVVLNSGDNWSGTIVLGTHGSAETNSKLDISGLSQNGTLQANSGTLAVGTGDLNIGTGSYIENAVKIETQGDINISGEGVVGVDDNDTITGSTVTLGNNGSGGTLNYGNTLNPNFTIDADSGNLNLLSGSKLTIGSGSSIEDAVNLNISAGSELTLAQAELNLTNADTWDGMIRNENGGIINADGLVNNSDTASLIQQGGELNVYNDAHLTLGEGSEITGGDINITKGANGESGSSFTLTDGTIEGGNMTIDKDSSFIVKNGTFNLYSISGAGEVDADGVMHAALVNVANGERVQHNITELAINGQTNFNMDIHARGNHYTSNDQFVVSSITGDGTARVDNWGLNGDIFGWDAPIDRHITLDHIFVDENGNPLQGNIEITRKTEFTPIGYYQLNQKGSGTGLHYTLDLVDFNPQVFRGQVATVAQWMNQLAIDDMLFTHSMVLPSFKDEDGGVAYSGVMVNRYASSNPLFAPYQYSRKDGGLWYKMYGTFENLNMNVSGLGRVGNNAYGALIGADFGLKELKNGWKFMPTAYVGYNGAHQAYPGIGAYQNGGQAGFLGTWYKNNFILGGLVYGGVYENSMDVGGHTDNAFNYFAGAATKLAYNWRFHRDWVLQPNLMAAYNFFGQQNWHSDYGQMGMMAGMLNGVNLAPGVNLIWEKETFSIYGTLQYMYNLNGAVGGRAGNVGLPQVEMERGYIQYGLGFTKRWGDRFSGYLQAVLRNAGRTGVGFQLGFNFLLGK